MKNRTAVAMSGGVDSSLVALLLKEKGFDVFGATMRLTAADDAAVRDAQAVAADLGIEHFVFDFQSLFADKVIACFLEEYKNGRTPNPCVECNRFLKFGAFWERAAELGAEYMATGHYIRTKRLLDGSIAVYKGVDEVKDQSYMVYHLGQEQLKHCIFLLGEMEKSEVRRLAQEKGLLTAARPESQDICFIPDGDTRGYIERHLPALARKGQIKDTCGNVLGEHDGAAFYTIGQRKGLGIAYKEPLYVVAVDAVSNEIIAGTSSELFSPEMEVSNVSWIDGKSFTGSLKAGVKIRYSKKVVPAEIVALDNGHCRVVFAEPQRAVTSGQSAVFYDGERLLGGGIID